MDFRMNFNEGVKVKLTGFGTNILRQRHGEFDRYLREEKGLQGLGPFTVSVDDEGYSKYPMWELMQIFGTYMSPGAPEPFEGEMIFDGEPIKKDFNVGDLTVNLGFNLKDFEEGMQRVREILSAPLSDFVSVEISSDEQESLGTKTVKRA